MSEERLQNTRESAEIEKIDLNVFLEQLIHGLKRLWWLVLLLTVLGAAASYFRASTTYVPHYEAEATLTITTAKSDDLMSGSNYTDVVTAQQMGKVFPYILTSGVLSDLVAQDLGMDYVPGQISVQAVEGTNLVTIRVTASDGQTAYDVLQSVLKNYPEVAQFVVGQTEMNLLDESGVPSDSGTTSVTRGSMRKGAAAGFAAGMIVLLICVATRRTIRKPGDFKTLLNIPCLGVIPVFRVKKRRKKKIQKPVNILDSHLSQEYLEALRAVRTRVERRMENEHKKTLMITSSIPGEGKSTVAVNLAISFAQKGKKVILVDCDLRNPSVQDHMNIPGVYPGIVNVLNGNEELEDALYTVEKGGIDLKVLCGSHRPAQNVEILGSQEMKNLLDKLEEMADIVVIDTSPSAVLVDALVLARYVPMALYVVKYDYAKVRYVLEGIEELADTGVDILGCVLNEGKYGTVQTGYSGYGRYSRYRYGYSRYAGSEKKRY
ncbi:MAG: polysaccharide biosynthesis tyrosine autokinase [Oliverpabstia sp.]